MTHILISGDTVKDNNLVENSSSLAIRQQLFSPVDHSERPGGTEYLRELVSGILQGMGAEIDMVRPHPTQGADTLPPVPVSYQIWSRYDETTGSKEKVWRIRQPMGMTGASLAWDDPQPADLLVIDDLGLGFCDSMKDWTPFFAAVRPGHIILKTSNLRKTSRLWDWLFQSDGGREFHDRLTVILSANTLRKRGAPVSRGLSWDLTMEETVREMESGYSSLDLALCSRVVVHFDYEGITSFRSGTGGAPLMEFFLYHPTEHEGLFAANRPGITFGALSIIAASMAYHTAYPHEHPLFLALCRGLEAARKNHEEGGGPGKEGFDIMKAIGNVTTVIRERVPEGTRAKTIFRTAFPHRMLADVDMRSQGQGASNLLRDVTGPGMEYVAAKAFEIVMKGVEKALSDAPTATYGKYITADREEIERINAIRNLILTYETNRDDRKPLSIAVFGSPGSGKSFAIKQLAEELFGKNKAVLEFNLSQFASTDDLHVAFHRVRDASIMNTIPLVFWDEFDSNRLVWLKEFLAPMQDAEFVSHGVTHPFGKAIFVFAGGTSLSYEEFEGGKNKAAGRKGDHAIPEGPPSDCETEEAPDHREACPIDPKLVKKPDFISRLKGYVNIKGPNPIGSPEVDPSYLIRRAIILRKNIERSYKSLIGPDGFTSIDAGIINAFLRVKNYHHGARSLESIVTMSNLAGAEHFEASLLPPESVLHIHVTPDFIDYIQEGQIGYDMIEVLAAAIHEAWRGIRDKTKPDDRDKPYGALTESEKEDNRNTARLTRAKLHAVGLDLMTMNKVSDLGAVVKKEHAGAMIKALMEIEHDVWLRGRLIKGFTAPQKTPDGGNETRESHFLHVDAVAFPEVIPEHQEYDRAISEALWDGQVEKRKYVVVKKPS